MTLIPFCAAILKKSHANPFGQNHRTLRNCSFEGMNQRQENRITNYAINPIRIDGERLCTINSHPDLAVVFSR